MSLFGGLDGVVESLPTLIDEEDLLFGGGEDLFEFLDEAGAGERVPTAPVVAAAPVVQTAPAIESCEPPGYMLPLFFPFGKPEPTAPQLKLSGVSSFKKINSRLLQGGALSDREEADAIRELERALGVLGHQKRFLVEHNSGLEKWTSDVYGFNLSSEDCGTDRVDGATVEVDSTTLREASKDSPELSGAGRPFLREVRVSLKCKGADKRRMDKKLLARIDHKWCPRQDRVIDGKKRASCKIEADKPPKRSKPHTTKVEHTVTVEAITADDVVDDLCEDGPVDEASGATADVLDAPGQVWNWLEESNYFAPISRRQLLPEDLTLEAEDRLGRRLLVPLRLPGTTPKAAAEAGARCDYFEDTALLLKHRLTSALVVPGVAESGSRSNMQPKPDPAMARRKPRGMDAVHVLDVTKLSLEQRVLVQLNGVGLIGRGKSMHGQLSQGGSRPIGRRDPGTRKLQRHLAEKIKILNRCRVALREGINAGT